MSQFQGTGTGSGAAPDRKTSERKRDTVDALIITCAIVSAILLAFAAPTLVTGTGMMFVAKCFILAVGGAVVSWGVNHFAIRRGAPLFAKGYVAVGVVAVVSVLAVGAGIWTATYSGFTRGDVEQLRLDRHGADVARHVGDVRSAMRARMEAGLLVDGIRSDFGQKYACEIANACVSGRGSGEGPTSREIGALLAQASTLSGQIDEARIVFEVRDRALGEALGAYQQLIGNQGGGIGERRRRLHAAHATLADAIGDLRSTLPLGLLSGYAETLKAGTVIAGRIEASERLTKVMRGHGDTLSKTLADLPIGPTGLPALPPKAGVSDTFAHIGHFLPVAAVTAAIDLVVPICLWIYAAAFLDWDIYRRGGLRRARPSEDDETFDALIDRPRAVSGGSGTRRNTIRLKGKRPERANGKPDDQPTVEKWPGA